MAARRRAAWWRPCRATERSPAARAGHRNGHRAPTFAAAHAAPVTRWDVAIIGSGNIGTDLMIKVLRRRRATADGRDGRHRPGLGRARRGAARWASPRPPTASTAWSDARVRRASTSCSTRRRRRRTRAQLAQLLEATGVRVIDLTPAAIGPYVVPVVNLDEHLDAPNVNMVTCGGQATDPDRRRRRPRRAGALRRDRRVDRSHRPGPGTRANIDEFTETTARGARGASAARARQGDHRAEPRRAAADDARHRLLPRRRRRRAGAIEASVEEMVARCRIRARLPAQAARAVRAFRATRRSTSRRRQVLGPEDQRVPRGRQARRTTCRLRRQPRHHDLGRAARRPSGSPSGPASQGRRRRDAAASSTSQTSRCATACTRSATSTRSSRCVAIARALDAAGVDAIEVAHGDGLAGLELHLRLRRAHRPGVDRGGGRASSSTPRSTTLLLPGIGTMHDLQQRATTLGARIVRIATHCTEADISAQHIAMRARARAWTGRLPDDDAHDRARRARRAGEADGVLRRALRLRRRLRRRADDATTSRAGSTRSRDVLDPTTEVGMHAHHNLSLGVANSIVAVEHGATASTPRSRAWAPAPATRRSRCSSPPPTAWAGSTAATCSR